MKITLEDISAEDARGKWFILHQLDDGWRTVQQAFDSHDAARAQVAIQVEEHPDLRWCLMQEPSLQNTDPSQMHWFDGDGGCWRYPDDVDRPCGVCGKKWYDSLGDHHGQWVV